jgi:hypothetical protein
MIVTKLKIHAALQAYTLALTHLKVWYDFVWHSFLLANTIITGHYTELGVFTVLPWNLDIWPHRARYVVRLINLMLCGCIYKPIDINLSASDPKLALVHGTKTAPK